MSGRGWEPGRATIVALKEIKSVGRHGGIDSGGAKMKTYDFVADVQPDSGGPVFRTIMHEPFDERTWSPPSVGHVVSVKCHPGRQKAKFDTAAGTADAKAQKKAKKEAQAAHFDAMAKAAPGTREAEPETVRGDRFRQQLEGPGPGADGDPPELESPEELKARFEKQSAIRKAKREGDMAEVERLTAELEALRGDY